MDIDAAHKIETTGVLISGTTRGLGYQILDILLDARVPVVAMARNFGEDQHSRGGAFLPQKVDLSSRNEYELMREWENAGVFQSCKKVILIANAAVVLPIAKIQSSPIHEWMQAFDVNIVGNFLIAREIKRYLLSHRKKFKVVNITTGAAQKPISGWSAYCSSKAAARIFFDVLVKELSQEGIEAEVEHIDPGIMDTDMQRIISECSPIDFPDVEMFRVYHVESKTRSVRKIALEILHGASLL